MRRIDKDVLITRFESVHHGKYSYSKMEYKNMHTPIDILCPIHGVFSQKPNNHLHGNGCPMCSGNKPVRSVPMDLKPKDKGVVIVPLNGGNYAQIDDVDADLVCGYTWTCHQGYAKTHVNGVLTRMHRLILNPSPNEDVDHIDLNKLNNRRSNMRICSRQQNLRNRNGMGGSSSYKGVRLHKTINKWTAQIGYNSKQLYLGAFNTEVEAAKAYDEAAKKHHKDFARLNFPE